MEGKGSSISSTPVLSVVFQVFSVVLAYTNCVGVLSDPCSAREREREREGASLIADVSDPFGDRDR